jgi:5-methylcytosine-specific restriction enzyme A
LRRSGRHDASRYRDGSGEKMSLISEFTQALEGTIEAAKAHGYIPNYFIQMFNELGGVETAKHLLSSHKAQEGLYKLWELNLLHESMEAVVLQDKFHSLFTESELAEAKRRLKELGYFK